MRIKRVILKHHGDVAVAWRLVVDALAIDHHIATADALQARDHAQQGRFAATGWANKHHEFTVLNFQVDAVDDLIFAVVTLSDLLQLHGCHGNVSLNGITKNALCKT